MLIPLGIVCIQLFFILLWVKSRVDWSLYPWYGNRSRRRKTLNSNILKTAEKSDCVTSSFRGGIGDGNPYDRYFFFILFWYNNIHRGDTLAPYLFIICLDNVLRTSIGLMKENGFTLKKQEANDTLYKLLQTQTAQMT